MEQKPETSFQTLLDLDIRAGIVEQVEEFPEARKPAYKIWVNFGEDIGTLKTSAQITDLYQPSELQGMQVLGIVNFPDKQIASFMSEFLLLGAVQQDDSVVLLTTERQVKPGTHIA